MKVTYLLYLLISIADSFHINDIFHLPHMTPINVNLLSENNFKPAGVYAVKQISSLLPKVDNIGHDILHANNQFISNIFDNKNIPDKYKKDIILMSVRLAHYGDDMGSEILQLYYNIIDYCL